MPHPYLLDMAVHHIDLLRSITGHDFVEVDARSWPVADSPFGHDPTVEAILTLGDGTTVAYYGTWAESVGRRDVLERRLGARRRPGQGDLDRRRPRGAPRHGDARALRQRPPATATAPVATGARPPRRARGGSPRDSDGVEPECSAADNLRTLATVLALARSTEQRRPVRVKKIPA